MMAVNPVERVVAPRLLAGMIAVPLLCAMFTFVGILGGYFVGVIQLGVDSGVYWSAIQEGVDLYEDLLNGMIKSVAFGIIVTWIAVFEGYGCLSVRRRHQQRNDTNGCNRLASNPRGRLYSHSFNVRNLSIKFELG